MNEWSFFFSSTLLNLNNRIKQLNEDNARLLTVVQSGQQAQMFLDQIQNAVVSFDFT